MAKVESYQQCIIPRCATTYEISELVTECKKCGNSIDIKYHNLEFDKQMLRRFRDRKSSVRNIFNRSGVWRFRELLPIFDLSKDETYAHVLSSIDGDEGQSTPYQLSRVAEALGMPNENLYFQFEGRNHTDSFKDNGMATGTSHLKFLLYNGLWALEHVIDASTGNTARSVTAYAANERFRATSFIGDKGVSIDKLIGIKEFGGEIIQLQNATFDDAMLMVKELARLKKGYPLNSNNPFRIEGQKTIPYRSLEYFGWKVPDWYVCPVGNAGSISIYGKSFQELKELGVIDKVPRLLGVNVEGAKTFSVLVNEKGLKWNNGNFDANIIKDYYHELDSKGVKPDTVASAIAILKPENLTKALRALEYTNGRVVSVSDERVLWWQHVVATNGFSCEPASAATVAGIEEALRLGIIKPDETVVGILTGSSSNDRKTVMNYLTNGQNTVDSLVHKVPNNLEAVIEKLAA